MKEDYRELHREIATAIASRCDDPAQWLAEVRRIGDALDLPAQRWLKLPATLEQACFDLVERASHDGRMTPERVREAVGEPQDRTSGTPDERWARGHRAATASMFRHCLRELGYGPYVDKARWISEREAAVAMLRRVCEDFGDTDWEPRDHLADVIDKHLGRYLWAPKEGA